MRIHLLSDLHNEFSRFEPEVLDADVVVLAGDIDLKARGVAWAEKTFSCPVLYVPGNHEFYGGHLTRTLEKMRAAQTDRARVLDRDELVIGGVRFLGATMWTDFSATGSQPIAALTAQTSMNDFKVIRTGDFRKIRPADLIKESVATRDWLRAKFAEPFDGTTVVITHHAPSMRSLADNPYSGNHLDAAFANAWDDMMGDHVALWVHGHSHTAADYQIEGTRVVCNPRGYPDEETGFDPFCVIEVAC